VKNSIRSKMSEEFRNKDLFNHAQEFAYEYLEKALGRKVFPDVEAIRNMEFFQESFPETPGNAHSILETLHLYGSPATVSQIGGRYFGFVDGGVIPVALAARWLADFWDQNTAVYVMSPIVSKLEEITEGWLCDLFGLPEKTGAGFVSGSSLAIFCGLAAARFRLLQQLGWDVNKQGLGGAPRLRVVAGRQAHATVLKAVALLGFGTDNIEWVEVDSQGRMRADNVPELDERTILILQARNVNSGAFDPIDAICDVARKAHAWVHIDGAFGLWAAGSEELSYLTRGMEKANSWSVDGHKTLNTPYDNGVILCRDREALTQALQASGSYIVYGEERDGMLLTPEMSRRARVIELWAALKYLGKSGVDELVLGLHLRAVQFADELRDAGFQVLNDVVFNQVLVACDSDDLTQRTTELIQKSGECWVGGSRWFDKSVIRISVCSWVTSAEDISRSVRAFVAARERGTAQ
jgi:glutamate/tyrosine decarboxylase-like PLP-dependent enzyme